MLSKREFEEKYQAFLRDPAHPAPELTPYRVTNAIIMAAGTSSRFAPLCYEKPKGLLRVRGEILIERQIRQLQEAGIRDITVVTGYLREQFAYLAEAFGVTIVENPDYFRYNNPSTLIRVADRLDNTYICSSDNYFADNVFEPYVYQAYYSAVFQEGESDEFGLITDGTGLITAIDHRPKDMPIMLGHAYFSREYSAVFRELLLREYHRPEVCGRLWEWLYEDHIRELPMYIRLYDADRVLEFDSLEELRAFDETYRTDSGCSILRRIAAVLDCEEKDIHGIAAMKQGLTNLSFRFVCRGESYVYRHPGAGTQAYISRQSEAWSMRVARELGLDGTFITMDAEEGWKLSRFVEDARTLDYRNGEEVRQALGLMRRLHDAGLHSDYDFNIWERACEMLARVPKEAERFSDLRELAAGMGQLFRFTEQDGVPRVLCHCDCYSPNFLLDREGNMSLIDWEYSGNDDPAGDLGTFICCSDYSFEEALTVLELYHGCPPEPPTLRHDLAYVAIASWYWFVWALYQESLGNSTGEYLQLWHDNTKLYMAKASSLYLGETL